MSAKSCHSNSFSLEQSKTNNPTLKCDNVYLHSKYNPVNEGKKLVENLNLKDKKTIIVFGMALGYHITPLLELGLKIMVIEKNPEILDFLKQTNRINFFQQIKIFFGELPRLEEWLMGQLEEEASAQICFFDHPTSLRLYGQYYNSAKKIINNVLKIKLQSYITTLGFAKRWHDNILKNLIHFKSFLNIKQKVNFPVFVIGSGPSIDENIKYFRQIKNKGIIIALAPVYHRLMTEGIEPHYIISTDAGIANRIHFASDLFLEKKTILITTLSATPYLYKKWQGQYLIINQQLPLEDFLLDEAPVIPMQGTVSAAAFLIAQRLSSGPIFLIGMDFAFIKSQYHFTGNNLENIFLLSANRLLNGETKLWQLIKQFNLTQVQGINSATLTTNLAMESYLNWLIKAISTSSQAIYTLNQKGALISGATNITFAQLHNIFSMADINFQPQSITQSLSDKNIINMKTKLKYLFDFYDNLEKTNAFDRDDILQPLDNHPVKPIFSMQMARILQKKQNKYDISDEYKSEILISIEKTKLLILNALKI